MCVLLCMSNIESLQTTIMTFFHIFVFLVIPKYAGLSPYIYLLSSIMHIHPELSGFVRRKDSIRLNTPLYMPLPCIFYIYVLSVYNQE